MQSEDQGWGQAMSEPQEGGNHQLWSQETLAEGPVLPLTSSVAWKQVDI